MGASLNKVVFQPPRPPSYENDRNLVWLVTKRKNCIPAFHIFGSPSRLTLLFSHGNAEDIGLIVNYFREISDAWNVNIFAYEYSGYGLSTGTPSEEDVYADAEAAFDYLTRQFGTPASQIVLYGRSLGSGPSVHLASKENGVRGLILQSSLLSVHRVALNLRISLPGDMFKNVDKIHQVSCPVFVIHGMHDEIVPFSHGAVSRFPVYQKINSVFACNLQQLYNATPPGLAVTPYWLEGAGHNNVEITGQHEFVENVARFLRYLEKYHHTPIQVSINDTPVSSYDHAGGVPQTSRSTSSSVSHNNETVACSKIMKLSSFADSFNVSSHLRNPIIFCQSPDGDGLPIT